MGLVVTNLILIKENRNLINSRIVLINLVATNSYSSSKKKYLVNKTRGLSRDKYNYISENIIK